jgi:hypothetical protein
MHDGLIEVGIFLLGAAGGALLKYLQDRRWLRYYGELVSNLSRALQQQVEEMPRAGRVVVTMPTRPAGLSTAGPGTKRQGQAP